MSEKNTSKDQGGAKNIKWVEGLRGIASFLVVTSHLSRAFAPSIGNPAEDEHKLGSFWHLPILRIWAAGSPWVALFFVLTGYVNILSPVKKARDGQHQQALSSLTTSTFRRCFRLILPTTIAGFFAWLLCQLGFYALANRCEAWWMHATSPLPDETFRKAINGLLWQSFSLWKTGTNWYEKNQWSLPFLLKGSMEVYLALLAVIRCTPKWRMTVFGGLWILSWIWNDAMVGINVYAGALLGELNMHWGGSFPGSRSLGMKIFSGCLVLLGLHLAGYPESNKEWSKWSMQLFAMGNAIFPKGADMYRFWPALGVQLVTIGVMFSPILQHLLSHPALVWLGGVSFPIYLIHGPIIRSVLAWLLFGLREPVTRYDYNEDGTLKAQKEILPMPTAWMYMLAMPVFFVVLFALSHAWNLYIEPWCAYWTKRAEDIMMARVDPTAQKPQMSGSGSPKPNGLLPH